MLGLHEGVPQGGRAGTDTGRQPHDERAAGRHLPADSYLAMNWPPRTSALLLAGRSLTRLASQERSITGWS